MSDKGEGGGPQFSADGKWWWTGTEWVPASQAPAPQSPMSAPPAPPSTPPTAASYVAPQTAASAVAMPTRRGHTGRNLAIGCGALIALIVIAAVVAAALNSGTNQSPTATSTSSSNAAASPSPRPSPTAIAPIKLNGSGQSAPHITVTSGLAVISATYGGSSNFAVELLDSNGSEKDVPINVIGAYSGSVGEGLDSGTYILKVTADSAWTITVTQPRNVPGASLPKTFTGKGQQLVGPFNAGGAVGMQATNTAGPEGGNFAVTVLDQDGNLQDVPINEIGSYHGATVSNNLSNGPFYLNVDSDGSWSITISGP